MGQLPVGRTDPPPAPGPVTITGVVWHDQDESRKRDAKEPGLSGWTIYADLDGDGERDLGEPSVKTDSVGKYSLTLNVTGPLTIREAVKPGWLQTFPGEPTLAQVLTITGGGTIKDVDFGNSDNDGFDHGNVPDRIRRWKRKRSDARHLARLRTGGGVRRRHDGLGRWGTRRPARCEALGDDNDNFDDENGIVFTTGLTPGKTATVTATVSVGSNAPGMLQGWIDFNRDGDWADAGEQVFKNLTLAAGVHALTVNVPNTAITGTTFARFRYGYEKDLSYVGPSYAGEVEDYRVDVLSERPNAVDDRFTVEQDSRDNPFNVLANDVPGRTGLRNCGFAT